MVSRATVTVKEHVAIWSHAFVTRQRTVVLPSESVLPDGGVQTTAGLPGQSAEEVEGVANFTTAEPPLPQTKCVMFDGQWICRPGGGGCAEIFVTATSRSSTGQTNCDDRRDFIRTQPGGTGLKPT